MAQILVVEDSVSIAALVAQTLRDAGHDVSIASTGAEGFRQMGRRCFDLVITDIYMPDQDGLEVIMSARRHGVPAPIIAMSTNDGPIDALKVARKMGARLCLKKPFDQRQLLDAVATALESGT